VPADTPPAATTSASHRLARLWWLPGAVAFALLRLPSFVEPHWYTDEAGYAATGREMLSGKLPYQDIWNNKPPLHLATVGAVVHTLGSSETALHLLTFVFAAIALGAAAYIARHLFVPWKAATAVLFAGVMLGLPLFDAELILPESLLIAPASWAAAIVIVRLHERRTGGHLWPVAAGVLAAVALCYQQTALVDTAAIGLILLVHPSSSLRHLLTYAAAVVGATLLWVIPFAELVGPHTLWYALVGFYTGDYNASSLPDAHGPVLLGLLALTIAAAVAGALLARFRSVSGGGWMLAVWAIATLTVPAAAQQPFAHFLGPTVVPVTLALVAALPDRRDQWRSLLSGRRTRLLTAAPLVGGLLLAGVLARSAGVEWIPEGASSGMNTYRNLSTYYAGAFQAWSGRHTWSSWEAEWDLRAPADTAVSTWIREHGLAGHSAVVWSSDAWPYLLADLPVLLPTPPIYNNESLLQSNGGVTKRVAQLQPEIIVTEEDDLAYFSDIQPLLQSNYHEVYRSTLDRVYIRSDLSVPSS
jgi:Dolichyl-phosphate-mannose-protein mannosyltransferase